MTIQCVTLETSNRFQGNPIAEQHRLRYRAIIQRQDWDIPQINEMEYDQYDNPATTYFIWMDQMGKARGVARFNPTDRPFMIKDHFEELVQGDIPQGKGIVEGSRFCIDKTLPTRQRQQISQELVVASLEYAISTGIHAIIGIMYPVYWKNLFINNGWNPVWLGNIERTPDGKRSRVAILPVNANTLSKVRKTTKLHHQISSYGSGQLVNQNIAA